MDNVKKVTSPATTKNDLKSSDYIKKEEKKDSNNGKKFREEFDRVNKERTKHEGNWFEDNYGDTSNDANNKINPSDEYTDSNKSTSTAARQALLERIKINTEIRAIQDDKKIKSAPKLSLKRNTGEAR